MKSQLEIQFTHLSIHPAGATRELPLRVTYPLHCTGPAPVIIFSHGATGSREGYAPLITHWAAHGYVCIQPTHGDSLVWLTREEKRQFGNIENLLKDARTARHWRTRPQDIVHVLDGFDQIAEQLPDEAPLLDRERIGVGGHSFGAHTAQLIAGLAHKHPRSGEHVSFRDKRPRAFVWISPQGNDDSTDAASWRDCTRPTLVVTGTHDRSPRSGAPYTWRIEAFESLPPGDKYLLFIEEAHHGFGGIAGQLRYPGVGPMVEEQVKLVLETTLSFWDAYLRQNKQAERWLREDEFASDVTFARIESR